MDVTHKPYDPEAKHDEVMAQLNADVQELTNVSTQLETAIVDATGTVRTTGRLQPDCWLSR